MENSEVSAWKPLVVLVALVIGTSCLCGCSLFVMAGKMFWGDPAIASDFRARTGVNLAKDKKTLLVICSTPESIKSEYPSLQLDLVESIHQELKHFGVPVVDANEVASWIDESGGFWADPSELADEFDADYIAQIEVERLSFKEENSPSMYRGRASGTIYVYEVQPHKGGSKTSQVFVKEFRVEYPRHYPVSADQISMKPFRQRFVRDLSKYLARIFHDYRPGDEF